MLIAKRLCDQLWRTRLSPAIFGRSIARNSVAQAWPEKQSDRAMQLLGRHAVYSKVQARLIEESLNLKTRQKALQSEIASKKAMPSQDTLGVNKKEAHRLVPYPKHRVSSVIRQIGSVHTKLNANRFTRSAPQASVGGEGVDGNNLLLGLVAYDMLLGMNDQIAQDGLVSGAATLTGDSMPSSEGLAVPDPADNNPAGSRRRWRSPRRGSRRL